MSNPVFLTMIGGAPVAPPSGGQWNSGYQYTIYTGVALGNLIATISPQAQIVAGGNLDASRVNLFQNYWSAVTAAGNIAAPVALDQDSWQGQAAPEVQVTYSGYYHYTNYDQSIRDWSLPFGDAPFVGSNPGGYQVAPADIRYYTLPSYESTFVAGGSLSGTGVSINNTAANAGVPSLGLAPGQSLAVSSANGGVQVDPAIARATAQNVLNNLTLPKGGLFSVDTAPGAQYLVETNPAFTNQQSYISSDYYLQQLGLDPQNTEKRLGDALYEQQLVQNQITSLTGKAVLGPYTDTQSMYEALLASGASLAQSLDLPLGTGLSASQVAALTSNVVIMKTEVVDGQSVLVPVVYLAQASQQNVDGPLIGATDIDLQNAQTFTNSGTVQASNSLTVSGQSINNMFGTLQSGGVMSLATTGDVDLTSATVNAGSLALNAGGNLLLNTATNTLNQVGATGATRTTTTLGPVASVNVAGNAAIVTGGNFEQNGANLNVGGDLGVSVGGNYEIGSVQTGEQKVAKGANGQSDTNINNTTGSSIKVGGVSQIGVGGDPALLVGVAPTDTGAQWMSGWVSSSGQPILVQANPQPNAALQSYILANYNSVAPGQVPSMFTYPTGTGYGSSSVITGPFTNFDQSDLDYVRSTVAGASSMVSTTAGRMGSLAVAGGVSTPCTVVCDGIAFTMTGVGIAADFIGQLASPNTGAYIFNGFTGFVSAALSSASPSATPIINELINSVNGSGVASSAQDKLNVIFGAKSSGGK
ncbi:large exoprotein involved in heme utilization and adhesion [Paraburkholderia tropica]|uniref:beta strand repeat-containing protein n=1 Tax=Paraburkholderia tropica TaxID=92647 RepID=UPI0016098CBA|nr:S-layer family protein [Paraburkholderia tropica]MBB2998932.1 large exoprotein involved in heme utilization and adhesion [Paraburkholderia tropica]MBB6318293.1 large exoprotein involved in heme utilization and adhesion [Paraburkholderia tropica]